MIIKTNRNTTQHRRNSPSNSNSGGDESENERPREKERHFDFLSYESRFLSQNVLDPFIEFLQYHRELNPAQISRCIGFFHRVFVKRGLTAPLFRLEMIHLLFRLVKFTEGKPGFAEVKNFIEFFTRKLIKKLDACPVLFVEVSLNLLPSQED